jgi:dTDP-4-amino-4,6-dideoxygalactose transaminase
VIPVARPVVGEREVDAVAAVLRSGNLTQGERVAEFEAAFGEQVVDGSLCVAVNSGTSALHLALLAAGIGPGDEVIVPSFTFAATANAVAMTGATPVFADIDRASFCVDPAAVLAAVTPKTSAVMPVHLYGHPAAIDEIRAIADRHSLLVIEDAAQAHAASFDGRPVGAWGDAGCFSFYPTKNMTTGEGGIVCTRDEQLARTVRLLRNQGQERKYENEIVGLNNRMTDMNAAIGLVQLEHLETWTVDRGTNASRFDRDLSGVVIPPVAAGVRHVYHQYTIRVAHGDRDAFAAALALRGVGTGVYYPIPVHRLPAFDLRLDLPETERACREALSLPVHPSLRDDDIEQIVSAVNDLAGNDGAPSRSDPGQPPRC